PDPARAARLHAARSEGSAHRGRDVRGQPQLDVAKVIPELSVGEALVSTLQDKGVPMPVERTIICPPRCRMGASTPGDRATVRSRSPIGGKYDTRVNRESAYEILSKRSVSADAPAARP